MADREPLVLCGPPNRVATLLMEPLEEGTFAVATDERGLFAAAGSHELVEPAYALVQPAGESALQELRVALPRSTPPGSYPVTLDFGKYRRTAILKVQPQLRSRVLPSTSVVSVHPGGTVSLEVMVGNRGNVAFEVSRTTTFVLAQSEALCRAIVNTVGVDLLPGERVLDRLAEELRAGVGGVATIQVKAEDRLVTPGQVRAFEALLRVPTQVKVGKLYWGFWAVYPEKAYPVRIQVTLRPDEQPKDMSGSQSGAEQVSGASDEGSHGDL